MPLIAISAYWNYWVLKDQKGDPFLILSPDEDYQDMDDDENQGMAGDDGENQNIAGGSGENKGMAGDGDGENQSDEGMQDLGLGFKIDNGVLSPHMCGDAPSERTECLQGLVTTKSEISKTFRAITNLVNNLEVSYIEYCFLPYLMEF